MNDVNKTAAASLKISEDVIITVAKLAALDVNGVAGLSGEINKMCKLKKDGPITVRRMEDVAAINIKIKVKSGVRAVQVAEQVQTAVKESVQSMTGVPVASVDVSICGIVYENAKK